MDGGGGIGLKEIIRDIEKKACKSRLPFSDMSSITCSGTNRTIQLPVLFSKYAKAVLCLPEKHDHPR